MRSLLVCLLVGCLMSPVWGQGRNWTFEEFMQKLEDGQPWTREKVEAQLGVRLAKISLTRYRAFGQFVYGEGLIVDRISYDIWEKTDEMRGIRANEMRDMSIGLDDKSSCFTREKIKKTYPGGEFNDKYVRPGGSEIYGVSRGDWGRMTFQFGDHRQYNCLTGIAISINRVINIVAP